MQTVLPVEIALLSAFCSVLQCGGTLFCSMNSRHFFAFLFLPAYNLQFRVVSTASSDSLSKIN